MRILFIAMSNSIHTARWINQLHSQGWDIHLFPVEDKIIHPDVMNITVHGFFNGRPPGLDRSVHLPHTWPFSRGAGLAKRVIKQLASSSWGNRSWHLAHVIRKLCPDIIHSLEMQHAGYLTLNARGHLDASVFPPWIVTIWGSDIYLFGRLAEHANKIKSVLSACDYYSGECHRDVKLAREMGFTGQVLLVSLVSGGYDIKQIQSLRQPGPTSTRRLIVLKGYQHWAGRALVGLRAIELAADSLERYRVAVYSASSDVQLAATLVSHSTGIPIEIIPTCSHKDMLRLHGRARVSIGLSISDGISVSMLEAMVMGSFPIQSCTSCANEWIVDGSTGLIVHPEDPEPIAVAIRRAVSDDSLVDQAAAMNARLARERLDQSIIQPQVITMYEKVAAQSQDNSI